MLGLLNSNNLLFSEKWYEKNIVFFFYFVHYLRDHWLNSWPIATTNVRFRWVSEWVICVCNLHENIQYNILSIISWPMTHSISCLRFCLFFCFASLIPVSPSLSQSVFNVGQSVSSPIKSTHLYMCACVSVSHGGQVLSKFSFRKYWMRPTYLLFFGFMLFYMVQMIFGTHHRCRSQNFNLLNFDTLSTHAHIIHPTARSAL